MVYYCGVCALDENTDDDIIEYKIHGQKIELDGLIKRIYYSEDIINLI